MSRLVGITQSRRSHIHNHWLTLLISPNRPQQHDNQANAWIMVPWLKWT